MPQKRKSHGDTKKVSFSSCFFEEELRNGVKSPNCTETLLVFQLLGRGGWAGFCLDKHHRSMMPCVFQRVGACVRARSLPLSGQLRGMNVYAEECSPVRNTGDGDDLGCVRVRVCGEWHRQSKGRAEDRRGWQNSAAVKL